LQYFNAHILIKIRNIFNSTLKINIHQSWQVYIILINVMFMELVRLNKLIFNIKFFNVLWEIVSSNILISLPHMTWGWMFYFALFYHPFLEMGEKKEINYYFLFESIKYVPLSTLVLFRINGYSNHQTF
jgi:hypothetical protein